MKYSLKVLIIVIVCLFNVLNAYSNSSDEPFAKYGSAFPIDFFVNDGQYSMSIGIADIYSGNYSYYIGWAGINYIPHDQYNNDLPNKSFFSTFNLLPPIIMGLPLLFTSYDYKTARDILLGVTFAPMFLVNSIVGVKVLEYHPSKYFYNREVFMSNQSLTISIKEITISIDMNLP